MSSTYTYSTSNCLHYLRPITHDVTGHTRCTWAILESNWSCFLLGKCTETALICCSFAKNTGISFSYSFSMLDYSQCFLRYHFVGWHQSHHQHLLVQCYIDPCTPTWWTIYGVLRIFLVRVTNGSIATGHTMSCIQGFAQSLQQVGSMTSKYGNQSSKRLPTTVFFSTAPSHRNGRQRCIHNLYSNTYNVSSPLQRLCKTLYLKHVLYHCARLQSNS